MSDLKFFESAWEEYIQWQLIDKKMTKKINALLKDMRRTPFEGLGKPEPLKHNLSGLWSRRIDDSHRVIYFLEDDTIIIVKCKGHYN